MSRFHLLLPRQSSASATTSDSTPTSNTPVRSLVPTTVLTSASQTSTSDTLSAQASDTSTSSPVATSTPSPTSTSAAPPSTTDTPTTSDTPSSSTTQLPTSLTSPSLSTLIPTSTTAPSSTSSPSGQETTTTVTTSFTVYVNGSPTISETSYPTTITETPTQFSSSQRSAIIGASAAGGAALLILLLTFAFCARRRRFKRLDFLDLITRKHKQERSRATLLDGEDIDDLRLARPHLRYTLPFWDMRANVRPSAVGTRTVTTTVTPESASAFLRDDLPHESTQLMDPFSPRDPNLDLGTIVNDVMGPPPLEVPMHYSAYSMYRDSMADTEGTGADHSRTVSNASNAALLEAAGLAGPTSSGLVRSSPLAQQGDPNAS